MSVYDNDMGQAILSMIQAADSYAHAYEKVFDSAVGDDAVLGDDGIREILRGIRVLLNGPLGRKDGGSLDRRIMAVAERYKLLDERGEL